MGGGCLARRRVGLAGQLRPTEHHRPSGDSPDLTPHAEALHRELGATHTAREVALPACREVIRACGSSIRAVHRLDAAQAVVLADRAEAALRRAQEALGPFPALAASGPLHDAEKEYAEARLTAAMVAATPLPSFTDLAVQASAWARGLAEAATELRRHLLDRLRDGEVDVAERLLASMDAVYGLLLELDYPDAITAGLRRQTDALRAVLERTRSDLTVTVLQERLRTSLGDRLEDGAGYPGPPPGV